MEKQPHSHSKTPKNHEVHEVHDRCWLPHNPRVNHNPPGEPHLIHKGLAQTRRIEASDSELIRNVSPDDSLQYLQSTSVHWNSGSTSVNYSVWSIKSTSVNYNCQPVFDHEFDPVKCNAHRILSSPWPLETTVKNGYRNATSFSRSRGPRRPVPGSEREKEYLWGGSLTNSATQNRYLEEEFSNTIGVHQTKSATNLQNEESTHGKYEDLICLQFAKWW